MIACFRHPGILCEWQQLESDMITRQDTTHTFHGFWLQVADSFASHIWVITLSHAGRVTGQPILLVTWLEILGSLCWVVAGMWHPHALIGGSMLASWENWFPSRNSTEVSKGDWFPQSRKCIQWSKGLDCSRLWTSIATSPFAIFKLILKDGLSRNS